MPILQPVRSAGCLRETQGRQTPRMRQQEKARPVMTRIMTTFQLWKARCEQRRALACLTDAELRDMGISEGDIYFEIRKPFWRE